jgi:hypothetical protein
MLNRLLGVLRSPVIRPRMNRKDVFRVLGQPSTIHRGEDGSQSFGGLARLRATG